MAAPTHATAAVVAAVDAGLGEARTALEDLVRIPSISAEDAHGGDVQRSADATATMLEHVGLEHVRQASAEGCPPAVIGEWHHAPDAPTVLLYAHHDVQPPGFRDRWSADPFEPVERHGRLYGRGSADDKAGAVAHAAVVRAWLDAAAPPCNVTVFVEGEEEVGSPHLDAFLAQYAGELAADVLVLADAGNWSVGVPGLTCSLRGLAGGELRLRALDGPVHSGMAGGVVPDPTLGLARVLDSLVDEHGDVAIEGFWDDVAVPDAATRAELAALGDDAARVVATYGGRPGVEPVGDPSISVWERLWLRPALTVLAVDTHPIAGASNQIVAEAAALLSVRLAPGQDPTRALERLRAHLARHIPWGLEWSFEPDWSATGWSCDPSGWAFDAARAALATGFDRMPVVMGVGGSIPFVAPFATAFGGIPSLLLGPADPESHIHGEDESLHLGDWRSLIVSEALLLAELATRRPEVRGRGSVPRAPRAPRR
jgi:acetylornithine deacetylase/succinyl-diaminopimelate desuccinylase-like protein